MIQLIMVTMLHVHAHFAVVFFIQQMLGVTFNHLVKSHHSSHAMEQNICQTVKC